MRTHSVAVIALLLIQVAGVHGQLAENVRPDLVPVGNVKEEDSDKAYSALFKGGVMAVRLRSLGTVGLLVYRMDSILAKQLLLADAKKRGYEILGQYKPSVQKTEAGHASTLRRSVQGSTPNRQKQQGAAVRRKAL